MLHAKIIAAITLMGPQWWLKTVIEQVSLTAHLASSKWNGSAVVLIYSIVNIIKINMYFYIIA